MIKLSTTPLSFALTLGLFGAASVSTAQLLVYEGFDYSPASSDGTRPTANNDSLLQGQGGSELGLSGTWNDSTGISSGGANPVGGIGDFYLSTQNFSFGDLATTGNYIRGDSNLNNDIFSRTITADLSSGADLYFSFLAQNLDSRSAAKGGIVIGSEALTSGQVDGTANTMNGIGIYSPGGNNWGAAAWNGTSRTDGAATTTAPTDGTIKLLIGHLDFGAGTVSGDQFHFYEYVLSGSNTIAGGSTTLVTTIDNVDVDEAGLDTLGIARQVNKAYDEIRIGTTLDSVIPVPEPSAFALLAGMFGLTAVMLRRRRA